MATKLEELQDQLQNHLKAARDVADLAEKEDRDFTPEEKSTVETALKEAKKAKDAIKEKAGEKAMRDQIDALGEGIELIEESQKSDAAVQRAAAMGLLLPQKGKSVGDQFVDSAEFKAFMSQFPEGADGQRRIPESAKGIHSAPVGFKTLITGDSATSGGAFVSTQQTGIYEGLGWRPFTIRDVVSIRQTNSDTVEYVRQSTRTNAAAPVPEATTTDTTGDEDSVKPESAMAFAKVTAPVRTIAHWAPATKRALSDAAQLRGLIDQELRDGLREEEEDQIVNGDGTGENLEGIATVSTQTQAWDTDLLTTTRKARTKVRVTGRSQATAYLLNPADWERIDLLQDNENRYYFGGPMQLGTPTLWGLPVVESEAVTSGVGYVGDFRKCILWDREQANISVSDSHSDFFIRNMVAILAEERVAFGITRPTAIVEMDLTA